MKEFEAHVAWQRAGQDFLDGRYSRAHDWRFDGGLQVPASSSPLSVPLPMSDPAAVDPEEALVAAAASCHMLFSSRWRPSAASRSTAMWTMPSAAWARMATAASR